MLTQYYADMSSPLWSTVSLQTVSQDKTHPPQISVCQVFSHSNRKSKWCTTQVLILKILLDLCTHRLVFPDNPLRIKDIRIWACHTGWGKAYRLQPYTRKKRELRNVGCGRSGLSQGWVHKSAVHCQMISLENIHTNNTIWVEQVLFSNKYAYTNIYATYIIYECSNH